MDINNLVMFAKTKEVEIQQTFGHKFNDDVRVLLQLTKIQEELGELSKEVLNKIGLVRIEKQHEVEHQLIEKELVDVIITAFITAEVLNIDIEQALEQRLPELEKRVC